ncbi:phosphatase PAP2 family protein [Oerskovia sp. NPDC060287]|uniref:phosphatase PAP2 family protein n=1 Tax=Oerskovia sp. NPDC060287 TaxID=3347095 RepID=UPI003658F6DD
MSTFEIDAMRRWQDLANRPPLPAIARGYSLWGEHAGGWVALGVLGACVDRRRRDVWIDVAAGAVAGHAAAVVLKRVVRRKRPHHESVEVLVPTPSDLSFPSAHSASTAGAAVALVPLVGVPVAAGMIGTMAGSRVLLGVHYPTDVLAGAVLGVVSSRLVRRLVRSARR